MKVICIRCKAFIREEPPVRDESIITEICPACPVRGEPGKVNNLTDGSMTSALDASNGVKMPHWFAPACAKKEDKNPNGKGGETMEDRRGKARVVAIILVVVIVAMVIALPR